MTVQNPLIEANFVGNGVTAIFATGFYFNDPTDVKVYVGQALKLLNIDYTVTGAGVSTGGSVQFFVAPVNGAVVQLELDPDILQKKVYIENGPFPAKDSEYGLDRLTQMVLRLKGDAVMRSLKFPQFDTTNSVLPGPAQRAGMFLAFDGNGAPIALPSTAVALAPLYFNVKDLGAKGDGVTDDTASIQLGINTVSALFVGGTLFFPSGNYKVSGTLQIAASVNLKGAGRMVTFINTNSQTLPIVNVTVKGLLEISDLTFSSSVVRTAGYFLDMNDPVILRVTVRNVWFVGFLLALRWNGVSTLDVEDCLFTDGIAATSTGIRIDNGIDVSIRSCLWSAGAQMGNGILITACGDVTLDDLNLIKCGTCLALAPANGQTIASVYASNCFFDSSNNGVVVTGAGSGNVVRTRFVSCWFGGQSQRGFMLNSGGGQTQGVELIACEFYACAISGLDMFTGNASRDIVVQSCVFAGNGTAINIGALAAYGQILGCRIGPTGAFGANNIGIAINGQLDHYNVCNNYVTGNTTSQMSIVGPLAATVTMANNEGFTTLAKGTATVATGTTAIVVNHGLSLTPAAYDVQVTPTKSLGAASKFWVDTVTATQFTIHTDVNPAANVDFAWAARTQGA